MSDKSLKNYLNIIDIVKKNKATKPKSKDEVMELIDDIAFDKEQASKIVTKRIYDMAAGIFATERDTAKVIVDEFFKKIDLSVYESMFDYEVFDVSEDEMFVDYVDDEYVLEGYSIDEKARPPKMKGKDLKMRSAKAEVMKKLNADPKFAASKDKLLQIAQSRARKYAKELGINPNLVNVDKITVRKSDKSKEK